MEIHEHAIDQYIERVMGFPAQMAGDRVRELAENEIRETVEQPDYEHLSEGETKPLLVRGEIAVPYDDGVVPTTYNKNTITALQNE